MSPRSCTAVPRDQKAPPSTRPPLDPGQREQQIIEHIALVRSVARRLARRLPPSVDLDDLVSTGTIGLINAVDRFDPSRGVPFEAYAEIRIRGAMIDAVREADWTPRTVRSAGKRLEDTRERIHAATGRDPSASELSELLGVSMSRFQRLRRRVATSRTISIDAPAGVASTTPLVDALPSDDNDPLITILDFELRDRLVDAIHTLPERERTVLLMHYEGGLKFREIGATMGVTESRICQIHTRAVERLRTTLEPEPEQRP